MATYGTRRQSFTALLRWAWGAEEWVHLSDEQLVSAVLQDLKEIMGIQAKPLFHEITRLEHSMPQYPVKHVEELKKVRADLAVHSRAFTSVGLVMRALDSGLYSARERGS